MSLMDIYNRLPVFAQNLAFSAAGAKIQRTRFGTGFKEKLAEFESHDGWSRDQLCAWRDDHLQKLVDHAYRTVPYYRDVMDEGGIDPASIKHADDLVKLPLLTKDMIKANPKAFVSSEVGKMNLLHVHTSGTTGSGFQFESTLECQQAQFACFWRYYRKHGLDRNMWQAQFSSRQAVPQHVNKPPFWRIDKPGKRYYMSAFHESPANLHEYYDIILRNRFEWISGYPSLMVLLAQWMNERNLSFDFVKAVTCGAENLLEYQADAMEHAFGVRPVQTYGQTENVAIFSQQPDGRILVDEDFSAVEFLPEEKTVGGGASLLAPAYSTTQHRLSDMSRRMSSPLGTPVARVARCFPSMDAKKIIYIYQMAHVSASWITCSKIHPIFKRRKSTRRRTMRLRFGLWASPIYA